MLKKAIHGLFQLTKQKTQFLLCSIFQAHKPCLKNGGVSLHRTQAVFQQPANPLYAFLLRTLIWLPLSFVFWYQAANLLSLPLTTISKFAIQQTAPDILTNVELGDHKLTFVTPFETEGPTAQAQQGKGLIVVEINPLIYGYSLPLLIALLFAAEGLSVSLSKLFIAYAALLPFQAWGVCFEFLKTVAFDLGPAVAAQVNFPQWTREGIALGYQFGYLILPPISTAILWIAMNRNFLNRLLDRSQPVTDA